MQPQYTLRLLVLLMLMLALVGCGGPTTDIQQSPTMEPVMQMLDTMQADTNRLP